MDHALAKELKDAGWPQKGLRTFLPDQSDKQGDSSKYVIPTLEELIQACGKDFSTLEQGDDEEATPYWRACNFVDAEGQGPDPIEAVARLWLALNKVNIPQRGD
jgi:hypothetical protein